VLFLDAEEYLESSAHEALRKAVARADVEGYYTPVVNILGNEQQPEQVKDLLFRLFRNRSEYRFRGIIHEQVINSILARDSKASIPIAHDITIYHYGYLDSKIREKDKVNRNIALLEQQSKDFPDDKYVLFQYGVELYRAGQCEESIKMLKKSMTGLTPGGPELTYFPKIIRLLIMGYYQFRRYEEAIAYMEYGVSIFQDYADLYYYGGLCFYELKAYGTSFECFKTATTLGEQAYVYGSHAGVRGFKSYLYMGKIREEFGKAEEALDYYLAGFRDNPKFLLTLAQIVRILVKGEECDDVRIVLANMCECCTANANFMVGHMLLAERSYKLAGEYLEVAAAAGLNTAEVAIYRAVCLAQQDQVIEAVKLLDQYSNDSKQYVKVMLQKAIIFWLQDNVSEVRSITDRLLLLSIDEDFRAVVRLLRSETNKERDFVNLRPDSSEVLFDILLRPMDHGDFKKVDGILVQMQQAWIKAYASKLT